MGKPNSTESISAAQRRSWASNREQRRLATTSGSVRRLLTDHPDWLGDVLAAAVEASNAARETRVTP